ATLTQDLPASALALDPEPQAEAPAAAPAAPNNAERSPAAAPQPDAVDDDTVRAETSREAQLPEFLRRAEVDPVTLAEGNGSLAERLGLGGDDDGTDVGPVR